MPNGPRSTQLPVAKRNNSSSSPRPPPADPPDCVGSYSNSPWDQPVGSPSVGRGSSPGEYSNLGSRRELPATAVAGVWAFEPGSKPSNGRPAVPSIAPT